MVSLSDRTSDGIAIRLGIAKRSQTIAVSVTATASVAELNYTRSPFHHAVTYVTREARDGMMPLRAGGLA